MKKFFLTCFLILGSFFTVAGQEGPIDLILLLDTSSSMSSSYRELNNYMTGPFLREFLRPGDTFHLIPFAGSPRVDVARRVEGRGDLETIIGRMLLQYPLDPWSDIAAALAYAENYAAALPARAKKIVLISDGDVSLQPGSSSRPLDEAGLQNLFTAAQERLRGRGITFDYIKVSPGSANPLASLPVSGRPPLAAARTEPAAPPAPAVRAPETAPRTGVPAGTAGQAPAQPGPAPAPGGYVDTRDPGPDAFAGEDPADPAYPGALPGPADSGFFAGDDPGSPAGGETGGAVPGQAAGSAPAGPPPAAPPAGYSQEGLSLPIIIGLVILSLVILGLIIFLVTRRLQGTPNRAMARAASGPKTAGEESGQFSDHSAALASYAASQQRQRTGPYTHRYQQPQSVNSYEGPLMLNLFVEDQNTFIGKRNIHAVKPGYAFTVGGGNSDFLIFLVATPPHIGDIRYDGNRCVFTPRKPQYFPDIGSQPVADCIGKTIRIVSDKNYELHFRFERYEDPLKALNRLLHSVQIPG